MLAILTFYLIEFVLFTITTFGNRVIIVAAFNNQVRAISGEQESHLNYNHVVNDQPSGT